MNKQAVINHLIQLQELLVARDQQKAGAPDAPLGQLDASISALAKELPDDVRARFIRLLKKDPQAIVPMEKGVCTGCGITLPVSLVHQVHAAEEIYACPTCARLLYYREPGVRNTRKTPARTEAPKIGIERFSAESLMIPALQGTDTASVLAEFCARMKAEGFIDNDEQLLRKALEREAIISTAMEHGLAFPHVRCVEGGGLALALGLAPNGVKFDSAPGAAPSKIIFFMVIPTAASAFYLKILSGLATVFNKADNREKLLASKDAAELWRNLTKLTRVAVQ